jgi:hypothetical protein
MPMTCGEWIIQGYRWAPHFGPEAQLLLQRAGHKGEKFALEIAQQALGAGLDPQTEVLLVRAGQVHTDPYIAEQSILWRKERMGDRGWALLVQWYTLTYTAWLQARTNARADLHLQAKVNKRRSL